MKTDKGEISFFGPVLVVHGYRDTHDLYTDLVRFFGELRPMKTNGLGRRYPETTVDDVRQVVALFDGRAKRADRSALGMATALGRWAAFRDAVNASIAASDNAGSAPFPDNDRLWTHEARRLAIMISAELATRPAEKTLAGSFADSAAALPGRVVDAVGGGREAVVDAGGALLGALKDAAEVAHGHLPRIPSLPDPTRWMRDLFSDVKWPLFVGAAVLGGIVLLPHVSRSRSAS
ncbi:MAG: hypothetical protein HS111_26305 [Kofleriaceae bacterium]|nr:hypothetical protein [Kofleriaceae bacterium]MCL4227293.1 hypothetical protein [Myxococcales bacterium]